MQICPSMPLPNIKDLAENINRLSPYYDYFQIDIGDGIFVTNRTVQINDILKNYNQFNNYQSLTFDFHLMVSDFEKDIYLLNLLKKLIKIKNIFIHFSAISNFKLKISNLSDIPIGLTLNPEDQVDDLRNHYNLKQIPCLQIMSVVPGVQGNPFLPNTLKKIEQLRLLGYKSKIFLDGAVNDKTLPIINNLKYKPDVICPGSFLTKTNELEKRVKYLLKLENSC
jgi:ribulose-phosphate 3-epimerase